ncbi:MAG: ABC transporter substrate-binding protein [Johnsonella sp.]|nr:ABC transporter substrate-binding protein [Johnsonella sp.]
MMKMKYWMLGLAALSVLALSACQAKEAAPTESAKESTTAMAEESKESEAASSEESKEKEEPESAAADFTGKTLNVVATSEKYTDLFAEFTKQTGAKVEFLSMSSGEVITRAKAEGKPMADVWFGGGLDAFMAAKADGLLELYQSPNAEDIPEAYKDADGAWIAKGITVVGFLVNNSVMEEKNLEVPKTWESLADEKYKGEVIMSNPAVSGTNYAAVKGLLDLYGEEKGWEYMKKLNANISFYGKRGKDPQEKTQMGEFGIGIIPVDQSAFDVAMENDLTVVYPEDGILWVPEGVAIFKGSDNTDVAKAFIDFMLTKEAQEMIAKLDGKDSAQIVKPGVEGLSLGLPKELLIEQDLSTFGSKRAEILEKFAEIAADKIQKDE